MSLARCAIFEAIGRCAQDCIARSVAKTVIDQFEAIQINVQDSQLFLGHGGSLQMALKVVDQ